MKHRQALIVALSYVIGFTTAFIAFGIDNFSHDIDKKYHKASSPASSQNFKTDSQAERVSISVREDGLYAVISDRERILSAQTASVLDAKPGWHHEVIKTEASPNGQFIYYCVQVSVENGECENFVFVVSEDIAYRVSRADGEAMSSDINSLVAGWTNDNLLIINSYISADKSRPWRMVGR